MFVDVSWVSGSSEDAPPRNHVSRLARIGNPAAIFPEFKMWNRHFASDVFHGCAGLVVCEK